MARNLPGPYGLEIEYVVKLRAHSLLVNCVTVGAPAPGTPAASVSLATKAGGSILVNQAANDLWGIVRLSLQTVNAAATGWTLWKYIPGGDDKTFICAGSLTIATGANAGGTIDASYQMISMRTGNGGIMKITILDTIHGQQNQAAITPNAAALTVPERLSAYLLSGSNWILGRDDSYPVAALRASYGQNETVWKKINRPN